MEQSQDDCENQVKMEGLLIGKQFDSWEDVLKIFHENEVHSPAIDKSITVSYRNTQLEAAKKPLLDKKLKYYTITRYCKLRGVSKSGIHREYMNQCEAIHTLRVDHGGSDLTNQDDVDPTNQVFSDANIHQEIIDI